VHRDADPHHLCPFAPGTFRAPGHLLHDQFDRLEPPLAGGVVAVTDANQLIAISVMQFFRPFLAGLRGDLGTHNRNLPGKCNGRAATDAARCEGGMARSIVPSSEPGNRLLPRLTLWPLTRGLNQSGSALTPHHPQPNSVFDAEEPASTAKYHTKTAPVHIARSAGGLDSRGRCKRGFFPSQTAPVRLCGARGVLDCLSVSHVCNPEKADSQHSYR
jgi:hypothetical protein